jgi:hypothetical protein
VYMYIDIIVQGIECTTHIISVSFLFDYHVFDG